MSVHANIEPLRWESDFFAISSAKLTELGQPQLAAELTVADFAEYQIVQAKVAADRSDLYDNLSQLDFRLVEGEIDLEIAVSIATMTAENQAQPVAVMARSSDIPNLKALAASAFRLSRFRAPWYKSTDSGRFYALWAEKAVLGTFDHHCLVIKNSVGVLQGFVTLRNLGHHEARIGLLAVAECCSGQGIGYQLMQAAQNWCSSQNVNRLKVATQTGNIAALRLYIRCGATVAGASYWLYR